MIPYELTIVTGDKEKAGTDAQVFVKLFGTMGSSSDVKLDKLEGRFERGREDFMKVIPFCDVIISKNRTHIFMDVLLLFLGGN